MLVVLTLAGMQQARALETKQVGVPSTKTTCNYPVYTMTKYGQGVSIYKKSVIGLEAGKVIKKIAFLGYTGADKAYQTMDVYIGNTNLASTNSLIEDCEDREGNGGATQVNTSGMTKFFSVPEGEELEVAAAGSASEPVEILVFESEEGFEYTGENIVIYINLATKSYSDYLTFIQSTNNGVDYRISGQNRGYNYAQKGYWIENQKWSESGTTDYIPVMILGYEGQRQAVEATVSGTIYSSKSNASGLAGATVEFDDRTVTTDNYGKYSFKVDDVDLNQAYVVKASAPGHEEAETVVDIKSGGSFTVNLTLTKLAVPATLSGKVVEEGSGEPIEGATITFNGQTLTSGADGAYSFQVANIDDIDTNGLTLTATKKGYKAYTSNIRLTGDLEFNVEMQALPELPGTGVLVGQYSLTDYEHTLPFNTLYNYSASEMIYPAAALSGLENGTKIGSIGFYGYISAPAPTTGGSEDGDDDLTYESFQAPARAADGDSEPEVVYSASIKVYMFNSEADAFPRTGATATDLADMTPVYEGPVSFTYQGTNEAPVELIHCQFDAPFVYTGKALTLCVVSSSKSMKIVNFAFDTSYTQNALSSYGNSAETAGAYSLVSKGLPVVRLGQFIPVGFVNGVVTDAVTEQVLEGVTVTLGTGETAVSATTDDKGAYSIRMSDIEYDKEYRLAVSYGKYNDVVEEITFTEETPEVTEDFALTYGVTISGTVTNGETQQPVKDAVVTLGTGDDAQSYTTDAEGAFVFEVDPVTVLSLAVSATADGYTDFAATIDLSKVEGNELEDYAIVMDAEGVEVPATATNLSADGTANCYIVTPGSTAYFDVTYKGNSTTETVGTVAAAKLVWQDSKALVETLGFVPDRNVVLVKVAEKPGNALVAVEDQDGKVLWSWHLWVVDYDEADDFTTEPNEFGTTWTFMDRNLGATSTEKGTFANYGMLYQWGRKDPFPGAAAFTEQNDDYSYKTDGEPTLYDLAGNELPSILSQAKSDGTWALSVENPMTFYKIYQVSTGEKDEYDQEIKLDVYPTRDWTDKSNDDAWGGVSFKKSIYDPSPVGYKVPVCDEEGATPYAWLQYAKMTWNTEARGAEQDGQWFPATGTRVNFSGGLDCSEAGNPYSGLWIGTKGQESSNLEEYPQLYAQYMFIINGKRTFKVNKDARSQGMSLRCVRENSGHSGVEGVSVETSAPEAVYTLTGVQVLKEATPEAIKTLAPGIYVTKGHKFVVK